ncbi:outer membrane lipoprotein-sorting protein, partial [bacterium]|nr:outer membrane lipoprotein-sorting protein [bacterium]
MDTRRVLISLGCSIASLCAAPSASEVYEKTAKVLSQPQIKFQVASTITSGNYVEEQVFSLARIEDKTQSSVLVCFASPVKIKGTAILMKKNLDESQASVFFPSLGRTRLIPKQNEKDEVFGLGLSFSEMQNNKDDLTFLQTVTQDEKLYYQLQKKLDDTRTVYTISVDDIILKKMDIYKEELLVKEVFVDELKKINTKIMITKWHIFDHLKNQTLAYNIKEDSIQNFVDKKIFSNSSLSHCT